jgi:hypothetical protein
MSRKELWVTALFIGLIPPIWAVIAPYINVMVGPVALIAAGTFVLTGKETLKEAWQILAGFLLGIPTAMLAMTLASSILDKGSLALYTVLAVFGFLIVLIGGLKFVSEYITIAPAWLTGWAVALTVLGLNGPSDFGTMPMQLAIAEIVGVVALGWLCIWVVNFFKNY